jgi:prepilin-type N-terminal cleavage/methylation domain-containing protein
MSENQNPNTQAVDEDRGIFRGFTLIELMLVVAIISILTGIAFISMMHYGMLIRSNASSRQLGGHIRTARAEAIRSGRSYCLQFDTTSTGNNTYHFGQSESESHSGSACSFDGSSKQHTLEDGIAFGLPNLTVAPVPGHNPPGDCAFHLDGSCSTMPVFLRRDGSMNFDGVVYLGPRSDVTGGTGRRPDRLRAVDWSGGSGRVRVWKFQHRKGTWR